LGSLFRKGWRGRSERRRRMEDRERGEQREKGGVKRGNVWGVREVSKLS